MRNIRYGYTRKTGFGFAQRYLIKFRLVFCPSTPTSQTSSNEKFLLPPIGRQCICYGLDGTNSLKRIDHSNFLKPPELWNEGRYDRKAQNQIATSLRHLLTGFMLFCRSLIGQKLQRFKNVRAINTFETAGTRRRTGYQSLLSESKNFSVGQPGQSSRARSLSLSLWEAVYYKGYTSATSTGRLPVGVPPPEVLPATPRMGLCRVITRWEARARETRHVIPSSPIPITSGETETEEGRRAALRGDVFNTQAFHYVST